MATYKNPWHILGKQRGGKSTAYGPPEYQTYATPTEYKGYLIYERIPGSVWDVVKDGVCVTQRAGLGGAKQAIDGRLNAAYVAGWIDEAANFTPEQWGKLKP